MSRSRSWLPILLCVGAACAWFFVRGREGASPDASEEAGSREEVRSERFGPERFLLEHDMFLPATEPTVLPGTEAHFLKPGDEVFGLLVGGAARAYPITMISYHHVVNDVIRGIPVAVTY